MGRVIPESDTCELNVTITATSGTGSVVEIGTVITIDRVLKLTMMPDIYFNKPSRMDKEYPAIDYVAKPDLYRIKDQTYIGTVSSLITDNLMDVYVYKRKYLDENNTEQDEEFLLLIPSLAILDSVDTIAIMTRPYRISGMLAMVRTDDKHTKGGNTGFIQTNKTSRLPITSYLENENIAIDSKLTMAGFSLSGLSQFNNMISSIETDTTDGRAGIKSDKIGMSQFLVLGAYSDIFPDDSNLSLDIARLDSTNINSYEVGNTSFIPVGGKTILALGLDI